MAGLVTRGSGCNMAGLHSLEVEYATWLMGGLHLIEVVYVTWLNYSQQRLYL